MKDSFKILHTRFDKLPRPSGLSGVGRSLILPPGDPAATFRKKKEAAERCEDERHTIQVFLREACFYDKEARIPKSVVTEVFIAWCLANGYEALGHPRILHAWIRTAHSRGNPQDKVWELGVRHPYRNKVPVPGFGGLRFLDSISLESTV